METQPNPTIGVDKFERQQSPATEQLADFSHLALDEWDGRTVLWHTQRTAYALPDNPAEFAAIARTITRALAHQSIPSLFGVDRVETPGPLASKAEAMASPAVREISRLEEEERRFPTKDPWRCPTSFGRVDRIHRAGSRTNRALVLPCGKRSCPQCRQAADAEDVERVLASPTFQGRPTFVGTVPEQEWPNLQRRIAYQQAGFFQLPAMGGNRQVFCTEQVSGVHWEPVTDLAGELDRATKARPFDRRKAGSSRGEGGIVTQEQLRREKHPVIDPPDRVEPLGLFSLRALYASRREYQQADFEDRVDRLRKLAESVGLEVHPAPDGFETDARPASQAWKKFCQSVAFQPFPGADLFGVLGPPNWDPVAAVVEAFDGVKVA